MDCKPLTREEIAICLRAEPEFVPVEENASASGDDTFDREVENNILSRVEQGDVWAWAMVTVTVSWGPFSASDHLGCCSYADENDFRQPGGYFDDMVEEAIAELNQIMNDTYNKLKTRMVS